MKRYAMVFNGRLVAKKKEEDLKQLIDKLRKKGVIPNLVSILVGDDKASSLYLTLKQKAADRVGAKVEIIKFEEDIKVKKIIKLIKKYNKNMNVHGIMVQLPLPKNLRLNTYDIISAIIPEKDVDGMRDNSPFLTPVTKAVLLAINNASSIVRRPLKDALLKVVIVGYTGFEGSRIYSALKDEGYQIEGANLKTKSLGTNTKNADILVSATGVAGLISGDMVKRGAIVIDVGAPKGDIRTDEIINKASFISAVPGGIGPVTISCLLENLVAAVKSSLKKMTTIDTIRQTH